MLTDTPEYLKLKRLEDDRNRAFNKRGRGKRWVYVDAIVSDEFSSGYDKLGEFSDGGDGAAKIRGFDENDEQRLADALSRLSRRNGDRQLLLKVIVNGPENREKTVRWIIKKGLNRRNRKEVLTKSTMPRSAGFCSGSKKK